MKRQSSFVLGLLLAMLILALGAPPSRAATITVTNTNDSGPGSLRQAIADASPGDTIVFDLPYPAAIILTSGELLIDKDLFISGPGARNLTISGNGASRVFNIDKSVTATIANVTIADGVEHNGAGIYNRGTLTLIGCTLFNNIADWDGGGIYNHYDQGTLEVWGSTFIGNRAAYGGGIKNESATATLTNCTFFNNYAGSRGGGIDNGRQPNYPKSTVNVTNCTFFNNVGGGIGNPASTTTARNTIVVNSLERNCWGDFAEGSSNNLNTDDSCSPGFTQVTAAQLALGAPIANPAYFPLAPWSVAIDAGTNAGCPAVDQRGVARPLDGDGDGLAACDVGSYEYNRFLVTVVEHPIPTADGAPYGITIGPDNQVWFTEVAGNKIGQLIPTGNGASRQEANLMPAATITEYDIPTADSTPAGIVLGPDGALWFTEWAGNRIGRITTDGTITEYPLPNADSQPIAITVGPDGHLWFCEDGGNRIGKMDVNGALLAEYEIPTPGSAPNGIVAGPDGALWFTEYEGRKIGRITTDGTITEYEVGAKVFGITVGQDGNLWFAETIVNRIGRITPAGEITEFDLPDGANGPMGITAGPFRSLWVAANFSNKILRVSLSGVVLGEYAIPTGDSSAMMIAADANGHLWFTEMTGNQIGQLIPREAIFLPLVLRTP